MLFFSLSYIVEDSVRAFFLVVVSSISIGAHPFSTHTKFSEKLTFFTPWHTHVRVRIILGGKNGSFSEDFAYVLNTC